MINLSTLENYLSEQERIRYIKNDGVSTRHLAMSDAVNYAIANRVLVKYFLRFYWIHFNHNLDMTLTVCKYAVERGEIKAAQQYFWSIIKIYYLSTYEAHARNVARYDRIPPKADELELANAYRAQLPKVKAALLPWLEAYGQILAITKDMDEQAKLAALLERVRTNAPKPPSKIPPDTRPMSEETFWCLISESRKGTEDQAEHCEKLTEMLTRFKAKEIVKFSKVLHGFISKAYTYDMLAMATIVNSGCSDDGFEYFLAWVVLQGQEFYEEAVRDVDSAGKRVKKDLEAEAEELLTVADDAYLEVKGEELPESAFGKRKKLTGKKWEPSDLKRLYPGMCKRHGYAGE
ncbi:MAG: DUF4240 domain-containing protein [Fimbriiglobus sp.]